MGTVKPIHPSRAPDGVLALETDRLPRLAIQLAELMADAAAAGAMRLELSYEPPAAKVTQTVAGASTTHALIFDPDLMPASSHPVLDLMAAAYHCAETGTAPFDPFQDQRAEITSPTRLPAGIGRASLDYRRFGWRRTLTITLHRRSYTAVVDFTRALPLQDQQLDAPAPEQEPQ